MDAKAACAGADRPDAGIRPAKLFIGGITRHTTTKQLRDHFSCYGRVLDCVAMRQPDGRPRGFGYVTLDSPAAADRCLAVPQVIDGRVVDMKRAVPEGSGASPNSMGQHTDYSMGMRTPHSPLYNWSESPGPFFGGHMGSGYSDTSPSGLADHLWSWSGTPVQKGSSEVLDCVELLSRRAAKIGMPSREALSPLAAAEPSTPKSPEGCTSTHQRAGVLSANAPEFVPASWLEPAVLASVATPKPKRTPFCDLTNITNIMSSGKNSQDAIKVEPMKERMTPSPLAIGRRTGACFGGMQGALSPGSVQKPRLFKEGVRSMMEIREDTSEEGENEKVQAKLVADDSCSDEGSDDDAEEEDGFSPLASDENELSPHTPGPSSMKNLGPLPSIGSAEHVLGTCKRCNFYPKGRCQNGANCTFCHYSHDKRKPSRQEKRDRRAARMSSFQESVEGGATDDPMRSLFTGDQEQLDESMEGEDTSQRTLAYTMLPGMPPVGSVKLPAPLALPGNGSYSTVSPGFPCLPPGLPPPQCGLEMWQPDEEVSPLRFGMPSPSAQPHPVLATVPMGPSTPQSIAASSPTAAGAALKDAFSEALTPTAAPAVVKEMCTIGTQTNEDLDYQPPCVSCCDSEMPMLDESSGEGQAKSSKARTPTAKEERRSCTWQREELLRIRGAMESTGALAAKAAIGKASAEAEESD